MRKVVVVASKFLAIGSILLSGCANKQPWEVQTLADRVNALEAIYTGEKRVAESFPDFHRNGMSIVLVDSPEGYWHMYYLLPETFAGGTPHVIIDKKTGKVLKVWAEQ